MKTRVQDSGGGAPVIVAFIRRERVKTLVRNSFPRRRAQLQLARDSEGVSGLLVRQLVDAVLIDSSAGDEALSAIDLAPQYPAIPFFLLTGFLSHDAPVVARAAHAGFADVIVEGVDDVTLRDQVMARGWSSRFAKALAEPPPQLNLVTPLQLAVWQSIVKHGGRPVRTDHLARELGISREHLSRSFAVGDAPGLKRVIDFVRVLSAAELAKNPGYDVRDVANVLDFASSSHLSGTTNRLVRARASSLSRLRAIDLIERFQRYR